jgi:hypothetical protein
MCSKKVIDVKSDAFALLDRLYKECHDKSPYIFGPGFETSGFKTFDADQETLIPNAMCINSYVLNVLSEPKTVFHISKYMEELGRSIMIGHRVNRITALVLMLSCLNYSFNTQTFPYCNNIIINQMWHDMGHMAEGDHVCCIIIAMATRGRSDVGFMRTQHGATSEARGTNGFGLISLMQEPFILPVAQDNEYKEVKNDKGQDKYSNNILSPEPEELPTVSTLTSFRQGPF